ncbi:MAG TPA: hypothetical protein VK008_02910 [Sphingobacteriaceae bacterium]|nr:hypothetical protein [Sphingobacteriaceae bacterium]
MEQRRRVRIRIVGLTEPLQRLWTVARIVVLLIILGLVLPRLLEALAWMLGPKPVPEPRFPMGNTQVEESLASCRSILCRPAGINPPAG